MLILSRRNPSSLSGELGAWWTTTARIEIGFDHAYRLGRRRTGDVSKDHIADAQLSRAVDAHRRQLMTSRPVHPRQLAIGQQARSCVGRMHHDHRSTVFVAASRCNESRNAQWAV